MKAACLLTDSIYSLLVSDSGGTGVEVLGLGFAGVGEVVGGDGTTGARSTGRGGVSEVSIGIGSWASGVGAGSRTGVDVGPGTGASVGPGTGASVGPGTGASVGPGIGVGASSCDLPASDILASDPGAGLPPDSAESWFILRVVGV